MNRKKNDIEIHMDKKKSTGMTQRRRQKREKMDQKRKE